jgi:predicted nucleic acid-binding protein
LATGFHLYRPTEFILVDTNILVYRMNPADPLHAAARRALQELEGQGHLLVTAPQNLLEFWSVLTRPAKNRGLNLSYGEAKPFLDEARLRFKVLEEPGGILNRWIERVEELHLTGWQAYDARLVSLMDLLGLNRILTYDSSHFTLFSGITVIHPDHL